MIIHDQKRLDKIEARIQEINSNLKEVELERERCKAEMAKPKSKRILIADNFNGWTSVNGNIYKIVANKSVYMENDDAFIDKESAQLHAERNALVYRMRVAALECPVDWSNQEDKYFLSLDCYDNEINIAYSKIVRRSQLPHFASKFKLEIFINSLSTDEQKLLICGVE